MQRQIITQSRQALVLPREKIADDIASLRFNGATNNRISINNANSYFSGLSALSIGGWVKFNRNASSDVFINKRDGASPYYVFGIALNSSNKPYFRIRNASGTGVTANADNSLSNGWHHIIGVYDSANASLYIDGVKQADSPALTGNVYEVENQFGIGSFANTSPSIIGNVAHVVAYNRALTQDEITKMCHGRVIPSDYIMYGKFNEGADTPINYSGNDITFSINSGGPVWSPEAVTRKRKEVNGNLVYNGDFSIQPPGDEATAGNNTWIDGTSGGSSRSLKNTIGWYHSGSPSIPFSGQLTTKDDYNCLHVHIDAGSYDQVFGNHNTYWGTPASNAIRIEPNTEYKFSGWVKVENVSGDSDSGAFIRLNISHNGADHTQYSYPVQGLKSNQDWTYYEDIFTTDVDASSANVQCTVYGHTGAATLQGDWYFRDLQLKPTTPITRQSV